LNRSSKRYSRSKHSRNKVMLWAYYGFFLLFVLLLISKSLIPSGSGGWSDPPIYNYILLLGFGICISILGIGYSYFAWTKSSKDFAAWLLAQSPVNFKRLFNRISSDPSLSFWSARLIAPIIALFGIALIEYISNSIVSFLLR
jgi:hypothetical protein